MSKIVFPMVLVLLSLTIYACQSKKSDKENAETIEQQYNTVKFADGNTLKLTGSPKVVTNVTDTIVVSMENGTPQEVTTGEYYEVERFIDEEDFKGWQKLPLDMFFIDIAYILQPGESKEFLILLHSENYKYESGRYRICKKAITEKGRHDLFFNFEIKL